MPIAIFDWNLAGMKDLNYIDCSGFELPLFAAVENNWDQCYLVYLISIFGIHKGNDVS